MGAKTKTQYILTALQVLAWLAFVGFSIEAGAIIVSYVVTTIKPEAALNVYQALDLRHLRQESFWYYTCIMSCLVAVPIIKASLWMLSIKTLSELSLASPFKMEVAQRLEKISYLLVLTWAAATLTNSNAAWVLKHTGEVIPRQAADEFLFMAGLIFVISQVFRRGVEMQSENELTV